MIQLKNIALIFSIWVALTVTFDDGIALYLNTTADLYSIESECSTLSHSHFQAHDHFMQKIGHQAPPPETQNPDSFRISNDTWVMDCFLMAVWQPPKAKAFLPIA